MVVSPAIVALTLGSLIATGMTVYASIVGLRIIGGWNLQSGSETQVELERKTYLVSTILNYAMAYELLSLFLFIHSAEHLHELFVGAMCAAGTLNANQYGYPTLLLKIAASLLAGLWIIVNRTDNQAPDYPLIKTKYKFLLVLTGVLMLETVFQWKYFSGLDPDIITSCCGTLFSEDSRNVAAEAAQLPPYGGKLVFFLLAALTFRTGVHFRVTGRGGRAFSYLATALFLVSLLSILSFISLYIYEIPTHHCPFCLLQKEYSYVGYPLYFSLLVGGVLGSGVGILERYRHLGSLRQILPLVQGRLCLVSMIGFALFVAITVWVIVSSDLILP